MKHKFALVLSGGGFKAAFQVGAIEYIKENWKRITGLDEPMHFDIIAGISGGSLNGVMLAMDKFVDLQSLWFQIERNGHEEVYTSDFLDSSGNVKIQDFSRLRNRLLPDFNVKLKLLEVVSLIFSRKKRNKKFESIFIDALNEVLGNLKSFKSVAENQPLEDKLATLLDIQSVPDNRTFLCGYVSLITGAYHSVKHDEFVANEDFVKGVLASTAIPIVWEPVPEINIKEGGTVKSVRNSIDGGIVNSSPLGDVVGEINKDQDPDTTYHFIIINNSSGEIEVKDKELNIAQIALRALYEITLTEIFNNDLTEFMRINELVKDAKIQAPDFVPTFINPKDGSKTPLRHFNFKLIQPDTGKLGFALDVNGITDRMKHGRQKAEAAFKEIDDDWPLNLPV